jgi:Zn-finger nucleic acid-binding protein
MLDDAGKDVKILNPAGFADWPIAGDERIEWVIRRVGMVSVTTWPKRLLFILMGILSGLLFVMLLTFLRRQTGLPGPVLVALPLSSIAGVQLLIHLWFDRRKPGRVASVLLDEGLCPCCGYNLHGVGLGSGQCVVCPECGASWRASRIRQTAPFVVRDETRFSSPLRRLRGQLRKHETNVKDDAGETFAISRSEHGKRFRRHSLQERRRVRTLRWKIVRAGMYWRIPLMCAIVAFDMYVLMKLLDPPHTPPAVRWVFGSVCLIVAVVLPFGLSGPFRTQRRVLLAHRTCPICVTQLTSDAHDALVLTTCPNCRARWRV